MYFNLRLVQQSSMNEKKKLNFQHSTCTFKKRICSFYCFDKSHKIRKEKTQKKCSNKNLQQQQQKKRVREKVNNILRLSNIPHKT